MTERACAVGERKWDALDGKTLAVGALETMRLGYGARKQDDESGKTTIMVNDE